MLRNNLLTAFFELARNRRPGVIRFDECAARVSKRLSPGWIAKQPDHRLREIVGSVCRQEVATRLERETFSAYGGRHHRFTHGKRLENLDPSAAAGSKRHDVHAGRANGGTHIFDRARDLDAGPAGQIANTRARVAADDGEGRAGHIRLDARQHVLDEVADGVLVRMPVHGAAEHEPRGDFGEAAGLEVGRVDAVGMAVALMSAPSSSSLSLSSSDTATVRVGLPAGVSLAGTDLPPFQLEQHPFPGTCLDLCEPFPDEVLDVVFEEDDWDRAVHRHVRSREQEISDAQIDTAARDHGSHLATNFGDTPLPEIDGILREPRADEGRGDAVCRAWARVGTGSRVRSARVLVQPFRVVAMTTRGFTVTGGGQARKPC